MKAAGGESGVGSSGRRGQRWGMSGVKGEGLNEGVGGRRGECWWREEGV